MRLSFHILQLLPLAAAAALAACTNSPTAPAPPAEPEVPRGDYEILVERISRAGERSFYSMAPDGTRVAPFGGLPAATVFKAPSPGGQSIACILPTVEGDQHLWVLARDGSEARPVLQGTRMVTHAAWSPDGRRFAISGSTFTENDDIWIVNTDGSGLVNIAPDPKPASVADRHPSWSPDGANLAFQSNRSGLTRLWIMDANGADPRAVVDDPGMIQVSPAWSPDGELIAFVVPGRGIGLVRPDGTGYREVAAAGNPQSPTWAPDGRLLFSADVFGDREIFALDPAGGDPVNLSNHPGQDLAPVALPYLAPPAWRGFAGEIVAEVPGVVTLLVGDVVADGRPDLLVVDTQGESVLVLEQRTDGTFAQPVRLAAPGVRPVVGVADLSRDRVPDFAALTDTSFVVWRGAPAGPAAPTHYPLAGPPRGLALADFDRDGSADAAPVYAAKGGGMRMLVHGARPDGELIAILDYSAAFPSPGQAAAADVNGDDAPDVVVLTADPMAPVVVVPGQGDITFGAAYAAATGVMADPEAVPLCADLDGDRRDDLVVLQPGEGGRIVVLLSTGAQFGTPEILPVTGTSVTAADFDRDADIDLVVAQIEGGAVFLRNLGTGAFARPVDIPWPATGAAPGSVVAADLDGDAWPDLAGVDGAGRLGVLLNRGR